MSRPQIHFITGRLAEHTLRQILAELGPKVGFDYSVQTLKITVAALLTTDWVAPRLQVPPGTSRIILPGYCRGDLEPLAALAGAPVERGPKDVRDLPVYFGRQKDRTGYGAFDIEIVAEINHCPRLTLEEILATARSLNADGADVIDVGCDPATTWSGVADAVRMLREEGLRVSVDSFNTAEVEAATKAGAELVLSVNSTNREAARDWGCEVVVVPDTPATLGGLEETVGYLAEHGVRLRIDPVLEPIGFGFAASLERYFQVRKQWPDAEMLMGIGNLTELTDVDSAGVNVTLLGMCQEFGIRSVLTTQVINWARSSVRECDLARRLVHYAIKGRALPKHVEPGLVMLRDARPQEPTAEDLERLAGELKDHNLRVFAAGGKLHFVSSGIHLAGDDPFELFAELCRLRGEKAPDASHAFYLGYEMAKALTALTLSKQYRQDEALDWGFLTRPEKTHRAK